MIRRLLAPSLLCLALAGCGQHGGDAGGANATDMGAATANAGDADASDTNALQTNAVEANTVEATGSGASIGAYGPGAISTPLFVKQAAISDMFEMQASKIALDKSGSDAVKSFAKDMIAAHQATSSELKDLLAKDKVDATPPTALDPAHARLIEELNKASPDKFDKRYLGQQIQAHREALGLMESYATHGQDAGLKSFAAETKPKIQAHLEMASKLDHDGGVSAQ